MINTLNISVIEISIKQHYHTIKVLANYDINGSSTIDINDTQ